MINDNYRILAISTSTIHGYNFLEYIREEVASFIRTKEVLFIPYAQPGGISPNEYTEKVQEALLPLGIRVCGLQEFADKAEAIRNASAFFVGGGNTFLLLKTLYELNLISELKNAVAKGTPYAGTSAGSNLTGLTIGTTNDMPIVFPPSFEALQFFPFNINPHYLDPDPLSTHKGETRETRIQEFHQFNSQVVIGLREGSWLQAANGILTLKGKLSARFFFKNQPAIEINPGIISPSYFVENLN